MKDPFDLGPYFIGAHGEQDAFFEQLLTGHLRGHFEWRRGFHPEDRPAPTSPEHEAFANRTRVELIRLAEALKRSLPVSNPRYVGHMTSDLLLPGVLAQLVTTLYNPNNISSEVAPVTVAMERAAAAQLAAMIGYATEPAAAVRAWGHLTGGGTVANIEALWIARAVRCWPVAALRASRQPVCDGLAAILPADEWTAFNLPTDAVHALHWRVVSWLATLPPARQSRAAAAIEAERVEQRGEAEFHRDGTLAPMQILVPVTAHYSWAKAARLLGFGERNLRLVPVTERMRLDPRALEARLDECRAARRPVLAVVPVLGTTEYGTIDPVHEVVALRDGCRSQGQGFWIHVDGAWGGYLASMFRAPDGATLPAARVREHFRWFPSDPVHAAFAALKHADSVTVDPHKLGYIAYGVGALLLRDRRCRTFVAQSAPYVFDGANSDEPGAYALEGSRPGAMAAAVCIAHRVLPLHAEAFGRLPANSVRATEYLYGRLQDLARELAAAARLVVPFEPDTNLACIAVNPDGNASLREMNAFMRRLYAEFSVEPGAQRQVREFYASKTRLPLGNLTPEARATLLEKLGVSVEDDDHVFLLRHTLMNPWLFSDSGEGNYIDRYCRHLGERVRALAAPQRILAIRRD